jgi:hypothetical protein
MRPKINTTAGRKYGGRNSIGTVIVHHYKKLFSTKKLPMGSFYRYGMCSSITQFSILLK